MLPSILVTIKLLCFVVVVNLAESPKNACDPGWFGEKCRFQCHCLLYPTCEEDGKCANNSHCARGYFGPACQYVDLAMKASADTVSYATDGNEDTCNMNSKDIVVRVSWVSAIKFTWLRLHVKKAGNLTSFKVKLNDNFDCPNERKFAVSKTSVDVTCDVNIRVLVLEVIGAVAPDVCSIYISGGRNVALKQFANHSSTFSDVSMSQASNAVDGDTDLLFEHGHCTHTDSEAPPTWSLYFDRPYSVHEIIIHNRDIKRDHITGFILTTYNAHGNPTFSYTEQRNYTLPQFITTLPWHYPITSISITKPNFDIHGYRFLVICELQAFGEAMCPEGYYGLSCSKRCTCQDSEVCFTVTGACGPGCPIGQYGTNCALSCDLKCRHLECQPREGTCLSCHQGYTGKYCAEACKSGTYGPSCALNCSENCDGVCDRIDGFCKCRHPFVGPTCSECAPSFYGVNCTKICPSNCAFSKCTFDTGQCISCRGARRGPNCEECPQGYYGPLCLKACSKFCKNQTCHAITGECSPCTDGYIGRTCNEAPVTMPWMYLITAMAVSTFLSFVFVWVYIRRVSIRHDADADSNDSRGSS